MIVAVRAVDVMAMAVAGGAGAHVEDDVVDVTVVLYRVVAALGAVDVLRIVTLANVIAILRAHASLYGPE